MNRHFKAAKVSDHVHWVGAIDWNIRDFHGYTTDRGTTYNAYLILADKVTLIDTVKAPFRDELMGRIASVIDPKKIDYIISDHSEMDHTGSLPDVIDFIQPEKVFASTMGVKALHSHFHRDLDIEPVKTGDTLSLGNMNLHFIETRMIHWPDSMFSYLDADNLLFSQDGFGMHLASGDRFADEICEGKLKFESAKYYANILMPFSQIIASALKNLLDAKLNIDIIAPDHGPIWRKHPEIIIDLYSHWSVKHPTNRAVVMYDTMWHSTEYLAKAICEGLVDGGAVPALMSLEVNNRSDVATEILESSALVVGTSTLNNNMLPRVADVLTYLKGLKPSGLIGAVFGSYGWSGEATGQVEEILKSMKVEIVSDTVKANYVPTDENLDAAFALGRKVADKLLENPECDCAVRRFSVD